MALTDLQIAQAALVLIGSRPISSFTANGNSADVLNTLYEPTVQAALCSGAWHWAKIQYKMTKSGTDPLNGKWAASYIIPSTPPPLLIKTVTVDDTTIPFDRYENRIYCDVDNANENVYLEYIWRVDESDFPADFTEYLIYKLAAAIAVPITGKPEIMDVMNNFADRKFLIAGHNVSAGRTTVPIVNALSRRRDGSRPNYRG